MTWLRLRKRGKKTDRAGHTGKDGNIATKNQKCIKGLEKQQQIGEHVSYTTKTKGATSEKTVMLGFPICCSIVLTIVAAWNVFLFSYLVVFLKMASWSVHFVSSNILVPCCPTKSESFTSQISEPTTRQNGRKMSTYSHVVNPCGKVFSKHLNTFIYVSLKRGQNQGTKSDEYSALILNVLYLAFSLCVYVII